MRSHPKPVRILPLPFDANSSYRRGTAHGPARIVEALYCDSANLWAENGIDLGNTDRWHIEREYPEHLVQFEAIENQVLKFLGSEHRLITLGGDHSITRPLIGAHIQAGLEFDILHFDAHPDLYDELDGNRNSHASPFARICEDFPDIRITQIGIRTANGHQRKQAERFGVQMIEMKEISKAWELVFPRPIYISLDLDCLDPAFAPGVSHHEPGGMSTRELLSLIQSLDCAIIGADIVEYNPERDINGMTGMVAAKLLKELLGKMLAQ